MLYYRCQAWRGVRLEHKLFNRQVAIISNHPSLKTQRTYCKCYTLQRICTYGIVTALKLRFEESDDKRFAAKLVVIFQKISRIHDIQIIQCG